MIEIAFDAFENKRFRDPNVLYPYLKEQIKEVITEFRGRGDEVHMHSLSFAEFMSVYSGTKQDGWNEYMLYGGLPPIINISNPEEKINFLKSLFEETYISDIVGRHNVRNRAELEETHTMENIIFNELKIRGFNVDVGVIISSRLMRFRIR